MTRFPGEVAYYFGGEHVPESLIVDEFRDFVAAMRDDLRRLSGAPSADTHTPADEALDHITLAEYLDSRGASPRAKAAIGEAYLAEYGLELDQQSCLNFLLFIHADRRAKFTPFGVYSDERWHRVDGNIVWPNTWRRHCRYRSSTVARCSASRDAAMNESS